MIRHYAIALILAGALLAALSAWIALPACAFRGACTGSEFCGHSSECPGGCVCAIAPGRATGHCTPTGLEP